MKLKEGTYLVKKEDWKELHGRVIKKYATEAFEPYPSFTDEDLIVYLGTSKFGWYGYDLDTAEIREKCKNRGLTLTQYIPKPKKPKALKLTLEEVMEDARGLGSALNKVSMDGAEAWNDVFGEVSIPIGVNNVKYLFRSVIAAYLEEVYKEKESK